MDNRPAGIAKLAALVHEKESRASEVARLLHDEVGQTLSAVGFHLYALGGDPEATKEIRGHLEQVIESVRAACNKLQSNVVERSGLAIAVELLVARAREQNGLPVELHAKVEKRYPADVGHAVYRVIELALDNVFHHAEATKVDVFLEACNHGISAAIHDNGRGFCTATVQTAMPGTGLILMEAYASASHLHLHIDSEPGKGTIVKIQTI